MIPRVVLVVPTVAVFFVAAAQADPITIDVVPVGNVGNAADDTTYGAVAYDYLIGKYEVTAGQYTAFLNAVAATDTYGLYNSSMWTGTYGCKIQRIGSPGTYTYSVADAYANRPVNYISWGDAARFANWLQNGQPSAPQGLSTTEDGAYYLNGAITNAELMAVTRKSGATWFIPTEDEWYKAAYYNPDTSTYFDYPTSSNTAPGHNKSESTKPGNNANYYYALQFPIDPPYYMTVKGEFELSDSPYGTFDQGGNVSEWNETVILGTLRGFRGGSFNENSSALLASNRNNNTPTYEHFTIGFRVARAPDVLVPEPGGMALLLSGAMVGLIWWKRR